MKILLTGYSGFLGRHLADALIEANHSLRVILHASTVAKRDLHAKTEIIWGSLTEPEVVRKAVNGVDGVVHSAWSFKAPANGESSPNLSGTEMLFKESVAAKVQAFAFISSVAVYGMHARQSDIDETTPVTSTPEDRYPAEKIAAEKLLQAAERGSMRLAIFRPGPLFDDDKGFAKKVIVRNSRAFAIGLGDGRNIMPNIHAKDVAAAVVNSLSEDKDGSVFNVTPSVHLKQTTWYRNWGRQKQLSLTPIFVRPSVVRLAFAGIKQFKKFLGRASKSNVDYVLACATRNLRYSNKHLKDALAWQDTETRKFTN